MFDKIKSTLSKGSEDRHDKVSENKTVLNQRYDQNLDDLFGRNIKGEKCYSKFESLNHDLREDLERWRTGINDQEIEGYKEEISDKVLDYSASSNSATPSVVDVDLEEMNQLYSEAIDEIGISERDGSAEAVYKVTEGLERALRDHKHSDIQRLNFKSEDGNKTLSESSVPAAMELTKDYVSNQDLGEGYSLGFAGAVIDGLIDYQEIERAYEMEHIDAIKKRPGDKDPAEAITDVHLGESEHVQKRLQEEGWEDVLQDYQLDHSDR